MNCIARVEGIGGEYRQFGTGDYNPVFDYNLKQFDYKVNLSQGGRVVVLQYCSTTY